MVFALVLLVLLLFSLAAHLGQFVNRWFRLAGHYGEEVGPELREVLLEDNNASDKLAVIDMQGLIYGGYLDGEDNPVELLRHQLKRAERSRSVKGVILRIDSPGGEVLAADEISRAIQEFQKNTGKPVVASMAGLAASGGYYVAVPCRWIVAHELTITGSIGVIMHGYNYRGLMDKVGVLPEVYKSGRFKDMMSGDRLPEQVLPEERKMLQALIDETFKRFKQVIADGRADAQRHNKEEGRKLTASWEEYADGRILSGKQAYDLGFVDELGDFRAAVKRARKLAKLDHANLVQFRQPMDFFSLFRLLGKSESQSIRVDWGFDLPKLAVGRLYFLFLPGAH